MIRGAFWRRLALATTAASALLLVGLITSLRTQPTEASFDIGLSAENPMHFDFGRAFSMSPTGDFLVYSSDTDSLSQIWYRSLRGGESRPIRGTESTSAQIPVVSPNGTQVAFTTSFGEVPRIGGGLPRTSIEDIHKCSQF